MNQGKEKNPKKSGRVRSGAREMEEYRNSVEIKKIVEIMERRAQNQPPYRTRLRTISEKLQVPNLIDGRYLQKHSRTCCIGNKPFRKRPFILPCSDPRSTADDRAVFRNSPTSLREVESTCGFGDDVS